MFCLASISNFRRKKKKGVVHQPKPVRIGKTMPSVSSTKTSGTVFPNTGLPAGEWHINLKVFGSFLIFKTITSSFTDFLALTNTFSKNFKSLNRSLFALPIQKKKGGRSWSLSSSFCLHYIVFFTSVLLTTALRNLSNIKAKHSTLQAFSLDQE